MHCFFYFNIRGKLSIIRCDNCLSSTKVNHFSSSADKSYEELASEESDHLEASTDQDKSATVKVRNQLRLLILQYDY